MSIFFQINSFKDNLGILKNPYSFLVKNKVKPEQVNGIFLYSKATKVVYSDKINQITSFSKKENIPIYVCINSLIRHGNKLKKNENIDDHLLENIDDHLLIVSGLGQLIEGILKSEKTIIIGSL